MAGLLCTGMVFTVVLVLYKCLDWLTRIPMIGNLEKIYILVTGCDTGFGNAIGESV